MKHVLSEPAGNLKWSGVFRNHHH